MLGMLIEILDFRTLNLKNKIILESVNFKQNEKKPTKFFFGFLPIFKK